MLTGSVAPVGKSRWRAIKPCLATVVSGRLDAPEAPIFSPSRGAAAASSSATAMARVRPGRRSTARAAARQKRPSVPAERAMRSPTHGSLSLLIRSPRTISNAGWNVSATPSATIRTAIAPVAKLRRIVSGTISRPSIANVKAVPLKTTARVAVLATVRIAVR
jgi:hypothetical protein